MNNNQHNSVRHPCKRCVQRDGRSPRTLVKAGSCGAAAVLMVRAARIDSTLLRNMANVQKGTISDMVKAITRYSISPRSKHDEVGNTIISSRWTQNNRSRQQQNRVEVYARHTRFAERALCYPVCLFTQSNLNLYTDGVFTDNALGLRCLYMHDSQTSTKDDSSVSVISGSDWASGSG